MYAGSKDLLNGLKYEKYFIKNFTQINLNTNQVQVNLFVIPALSLASDEAQPCTVVER
jgi:hypothetical protein